MIKILYALSSLMVLVGAFLKLQHYPNGLSILLVGFALGSITGWIDTSRQKKKIKELEKQLKQKE